MKEELRSCSSNTSPRLPSEAVTGVDLLRFGQGARGSTHDDKPAKLAARFDQNSLMHQAAAESVSRDRTDRTRVVDRAISSG